MHACSQVVVELREGATVPEEWYDDNRHGAQHTQLAGHSFGKWVSARFLEYFVSNIFTRNDTYKQYSILDTIVDCMCSF